MNSARHVVLLACALLFLLGVNVVWLSFDHSIPAWDDAYYLTNSLLTYDAFTNGGIPGLARQFLFGMSAKPPLIATLPIPIYLAAGRLPRAALAVNLVFLFVILAGSYLLATQFAGRRAGLFALCMAGTMPMIYGLSRIYLVECGLTALVTTAFLVVASSDDGLSPLIAPALGIICGLGVLMKTSFPLYVVTPLLWLATWRGREMLRGKRIAAFLTALLVVAGPWYAVNIIPAIRTLAAAGSAETARIYHPAGLAAAKTYLMNVLNCGPVLYFASLPVLAFLGRDRIGSQARRGMTFCLAAVAPMIFLAFSNYREVRFTAPLFPVIAVAAGILADAAIARFRALGMTLAGLLLAVGMADMLNASFGILGPTFEGGLLLSTARFSYVAAPWRTPSPYPDLLAVMQLNSTGTGRPRLVLGSDTRYCNADNVGLAALALWAPIDVATTTYQNPAVLRPLLNSASFFAYVEGAKDSPFNPLGQSSAKLIAADPHFRPLADANLPDGSRLHVLAGQAQEPSHLSQAGTLLKGEMESIPDCSVKFSDGIELVGLSLRAVPNGIEARYRWRCTRPMSRNFWSFGHVLDSGGKILGYLDHAILPNNPTSRWDTGDTVVESVILPLPNGVPASVRLGVFDKQADQRLTIVSSSFPLADSTTSTVSPMR